MKKILDAVSGFFMPVLIVALLGLGFYTFNVYSDRGALQTTVSSLHNEVGQLGEQLKSTAATNKRLASEIDLLKKSQTITDDIKDKLDAGAKEDKKRFEAMSKQVGDKLAAIEAKYKALEPTKDNLDRKAIDISLERSRGVYHMYCLVEPAAKECVK